MRPLISSAILCLTASLAQSAVISHESFTGYTAGELPDNSAPAVAGYTGNWGSFNWGNQQPAVTTGSLTYSNPSYLGSSGDRVTVPFNTSGGEITIDNSGRAHRSLDSLLAVTTGTSGVLYLSFLFQTGNETGGSIYQSLALNQGINGDTGRAFDLGAYNTSTFNFAANGTTTSLGAIDANVHLFVVKFDLSTAAGGDSVTTWIDPTLGAGDPSGGLTVSGQDLTWDTLMLSDYEGSSAAWDEIRWGTDFNSVTVPEPASALFASIGLVGLLKRRRSA